MDAKHLRIGNWVYNPNLQEYRKVDVLDLRDSFERRLFQPFCPIELTPEILEKAGFEFEDLGDDPPYERWVFTNEKELWVWDFNSEHWIFCVGDYETHRDDFKYVHQLQNLIFALRGEELPLNLHR